MSSPLTGITQTVGFVQRGVGDHRLYIAGGEMTGVHVLHGIQPPSPGSYHIGGSGYTYDEAVIRTLGETLERYSHFAQRFESSDRLCFDSFAELSVGPTPPLVAPNQSYFTSSQLSQSRFPFEPFDPVENVQWVRCRSLHDGQSRWMAAQEAFPGYRGRPGEPHFTAGVTTGSAAHVDVANALRNALLEVIQIDAAMGHWYGAAQAISIEPDSRLRHVMRAISRRATSDEHQNSFYWLRSADLPGFPIACVRESSELPRIAVGLGCDMHLESAISKAFLECAAVAQLAKVILFRVAAEQRHVDGDEIYNLDDNVAFHALERQAGLTHRFSLANRASAMDLPPDIDSTIGDDLRHIVRAFRDSDKELVVLDLSSSEIRDLGFVSLRAWSPDTLTLSLPSAPPLAHERFHAYGGTGREDPHPYP